MYSTLFSGHRSIGECLIQGFGCSKQKATEMLAEYPNFHWPKFLILRKYGVDADSILNHLKSVRRCSVKGKLRIFYFPYLQSHTGRGYISSIDFTRLK